MRLFQIGFTSLLLLLRRPMQSKGGREKEKQNDNSHIREEEQDDAAQLFLVHLKQMHYHPGGGVPKGEGGDAKKDRENNSDHKHAQK